MSFRRSDPSGARASRRTASGARRALTPAAVSRAAVARAAVTRAAVTRAAVTRAAVTRAALAAALLGAVLMPRAAAADDGLSQCMSSYEAGQRLRREGDLVGAASELLVCGGPACPVRMQGDCQRWLDDVERSTPAVVFRVRDGGGAWLADVTASIDGAAPRRLDGRAIAMNPGEHVVVFEREGYRPLRTPVIVAEGEKLERRVITLDAVVASDPSYTPAPASGGATGTVQRLQPGVDPQRERAAGTGEDPVSAGPESSIPWGPVALGAVAVAGGVGFAYFGMHAQSGEADLEQCTPNCSQARVDDVKEDFLRSNVSLGIGIAGIVGAGLWLILDRPSSADAGPQTRAARSTFGFGPTPYWVARF
jgi:hypothetical protein